MSLLAIGADAYAATPCRYPATRVHSDRNGLIIVSWDTALSCQPDWILVTSWNEWYEGSQIEPSVECGHDYITLTRQQAKRFRQL